MRKGQSSHWRDLARLGRGSSSQTRKWRDEDVLFRHSCTDNAQGGDADGAAEQRSERRSPVANQKPLHSNCNAYTPLTGRKIEDEWTPSQHHKNRPVNRRNSRPGSAAFFVRHHTLRCLQGSSQDPVSRRQSAGCWWLRQCLSRHSGTLPCQRRLRSCSKSNGSFWTAAQDIVEAPI